MSEFTVNFDGADIVVELYDPATAALLAQISAAAASAAEDAEDAEIAAAVAVAAAASADAAEAIRVTAPFATTLTTIGATPTLADGGLSGDGRLHRLNETIAAEGFLASVSVWIATLGDGTIAFEVTLPYSDGAGGTRRAVIHRQTISGIAGTGLKTFVAGIGFPAGLWIPAAAEIWFGSSAAGADPSVAIDIGNGVRKDLGAGGGYDAGVETGANYKAVARIVLTTAPDTLAAAIVAAQTIAGLGGPDGTEIEWNVPDQYILQSAAGDSGFIPQGTHPVLGDGLLDGIEYNCHASDTGDCYFIVFRDDGSAVKHVDHWRATLVAGKQQYATCPKDIVVRAGDLVWMQPITGSVGQVYINSAPQNPYFAANQYLFDDLAFVRTYPNLAQMRVAVRRARRGKQLAQAATRGRTVTLDQGFPGGALPAGWANTAAAFTVAGGALVGPSAPAASWSNSCLYGYPSNAHRRTSTALIEMGHASNIGGLNWQSQTGAAYATSTIAAIDGPAGKLRVFRAAAPAPFDAGLEVALPWAVNAADVIQLSGTIERSVLTVTARLMSTGQEVSIAAPWNLAAINGGLMRGQLGAVFYSGTGGMKWRRIRNIAHWAKRAGAKLFFGDSTADVHGGQFTRTWPMLLEDQYGHGDFLNCSCSALNPAHSLAQAAQDFTALVGNGASDGVGIEVFWGIGVNPDSSGGNTDAQRYAAYKASTLAMAAIVEATGAKFTIVTPTPANYLTGYVDLLVDSLLAGDCDTGGVVREVIDTNRMQATSNANRGTWGSADWTDLGDNLHPDPIYRTPVILADFLAQRPDLRGA